MARRQSFADKVSKRAHTVICPVCSSQIDYVKLVDPAYSEAKKSWKFKNKLVGICKCNEKEVLA